MENNISGIPLSKVTPITVTVQPQKFSGELRELTGPSEEGLRRAREYHETLRVSTIFEVGGKILGNVGEDGSSTFYKREDSPAQGDRQLSVAEHINRLRKIYGNQLKVTTYPMGEGPLGKDVNRLAVGQSYRSINERV